MEAKENQKLDWELLEDYYEASETEELRLEDFLEPEQEHGGEQTERELEKTAALVTAVLKAAGEGKRSEEIAAALGIFRGEVEDILVCVQAFPEDDPMAVARLLVMG